MTITNNNEQLQKSILKIQTLREEYTSFAGLLVPVSYAFTNPFEFIFFISGQELGLVEHINDPLLLVNLATLPQPYLHN
jgi:hypothetical protein